MAAPFEQLDPETQEAYARQDDARGFIDRLEEIRDNPARRFLEELYVAGVMEAERKLLAEASALDTDN